MDEDELITMYSAQAMIAAGLKRLCSQAANRTSKSIKVLSAAKDGERPAKRVTVSRVPRIVLESCRLRPIPPYSQSAMSSRVAVRGWCLRINASRGWPRRQRSYVRKVADIQKCNAWAKSALTRKGS